MPIPKLAAVILLAALWAACAHITPLEGGDKDTTPPQVDTSRSSPMSPVHTHPREIRLAFNEWIRLDNPFKNILISPPLSKRPEIKLKGKAVVVRFADDEDFHDNTTYVINFGSAIKDITEGNAAQGLAYVFSTGPDIDSLTLEGSVVDARTGQGVEQVSVMLYKELDDSVVYKQKPYYLAFTDKTGHFQFQYLHPGRYKIFALRDADNDYLYSQPGEAIAFADSTVRAGRPEPYHLRLSVPELPLKVKDIKQPASGMLQLVFNRPAHRPEVTGQHIKTLFYEPKGDTLTLWIDGRDTSSALILKEEGHVVDTIQPGREKKSLDSLQAVRGLGTGTRQLTPVQMFSLQFSMPVVRWNPDRFVVRQDSNRLDITHIRRDSVRPTVLYIDWPRSEGHTYALDLLPGAITGFDGRTNPDTIHRRVTVLEKSKLGNISVTIHPPDSTAHYVLRLLSADKKEVERLVLEPLRFSCQWPLQRPGQYSLELILDHNRNGRWDPADYRAHQQPEPIFVKKLEPLRANWDLDVQWTPAQPAAPAGSREKIRQ